MSPWDNRASAQRLTASRKNSYKMIATKSSTESGAQRLTASRKNSFDDVLFLSEGGVGAQRLTASRKNSFCGSSFGLNVYRVLNASRHHGKIRVTSPLLEECFPMCSTP